MTGRGPIIRLANFIIYSNAFISAGAACFTLHTALLFPEHASILREFSVLNFITTFVLYNLQRLYFSAQQDTGGKYNWYNRHRRLVFTLILLLLISYSSHLFDFFSRHPHFLIGYTLLALLGLLYFLPPLSLRKFGMLKPFLIAFVFVGTGILLPLLDQLTGEVLLHAFSQFLFIAALCVLFDVKDADHDRSLGLRTMPVILGVTKARTLCILLLTGFVATGSPGSTAAFACNLTVASTAIVFCFLTGKPRSPYFYFLLVDGLIPLQFLLLDTWMGA